MPKNNLFLQFTSGPIQMECDAQDLVVEDEIPPDLNVSLYRNGPNQRYTPRGDYHLFADDGMVCVPFILKTARPVITTVGCAPLSLIWK